MHILTFSGWVNISYLKTAGIHTFVAQPRTPYIFSFAQYESVTKTPEVSKLVVLQSLFWPRLPPFVVRPTGGRGESVLFFSGSGGYGDQIMAWPAAKLLADLGYQVHVLTDPGNNHLWSFPWVHSVRMLPLPVTDLQAFNHLALFPYVTNVDEHPGQPHPTDHLMRLMGVDPATVPPERKRVRPELTLGQLNELGGGRKFNIIQIAGSSNLRRPSPEKLKGVLSELVQKIPVPWFALHDQGNDPHTQAAQEVAAERPNLQVAVNIPFDQLMGLTAGAQLSISPDSFITHLRGALGLPGICVFGTHEPALRTRYYPEMIPVWEKAACPSSPCLVYRNEFPKYLCPPSAEPRKECAVISAGYDRVVQIAVDTYAQISRTC